MTNLKFFGENAKFHHVGIAVKEIPADFQEAQQWTDPIQKVTVAFGELSGLPVEVICPASPNSPIDDNLKKNMKLVHLCYEVKKIESALDTAKSFGFIQIASPQPATAFEQRKIVWLYHKYYGLFELVEAPN